MHEGHGRRVVVVVVVACQLRLYLPQRGDPNSQPPRALQLSSALNGRAVVLPAAGGGDGAGAEAACRDGDGRPGGAGASGGR